MKHPVDAHVGKRIRHRRWMVGMTQQQLADSIGKSRSHVANTLRLLQLPDSVLNHVMENRLSAGHARALLGLPDAAAMERLAQRIVAEGLAQFTDRLRNHVGRKRVVTPQLVHQFFARRNKGQRVFHVPREATYPLHAKVGGNALYRMRQTGRAAQIAAGKQPAQLPGALAVVIHKTQQQLAVLRN